MAEDFLRVHSFWPRSAANGPGLRAVLWLQGCTLNCPGCYNPQTHDPQGGQAVPVTTLAGQILALPEIEGLTLSGGEPLQQARPLRRLLDEVRAASRLSVILFTGYTWAEIQAWPEAQAVLAGVDVLISGRYVATQRLARDLRGSTNKEIHFLTPRYTPAEISAVPQAEVIITPAGEVLLSGIYPLQWTSS